MPGEDEATQRFQALWQEAKEGPKTVAATSTKTVEVDLSPLTMLKYLRHVADKSHGRGDMKEDQYKLVLQSSKQLEAAFSGLPIDKLRDLVHDLKHEFQSIRDRHGLDQP